MIGQIACQSISRQSVNYYSKLAKTFFYVVFHSVGSLLCQNSFCVYPQNKNNHGRSVKVAQFHENSDKNSSMDMFSPKKLSFIVTSG